MIQRRSIQLSMNVVSARSFTVSMSGVLPLAVVFRYVNSIIPILWQKSSHPALGKIARSHASKGLFLVRTTWTNYTFVFTL